MGRWAASRSVARSWSDTLPRAADGGAGRSGSPYFWGQGRLPVTGRIDVRLARQATRETSRGGGVYLK